MTPSEIRAIADSVGGQSELSRLSGINGRTVRGWIEDPPRTKPKPGAIEAIVDAWALVALQHLVQDLVVQAGAAGTLRGQAVTLRAKIPAGISHETEARLRARLQEFCRTVIETPFRIA